MGRQVTAALEDAFPGRAVAETDETGPSWNETNETAEVRFADGETVYCKVAVDGDGSRIAREHAVISFLRARSEVRVPDVVAADPDAVIPYLATAPMAGRNLAFAWADATPTSGQAWPARSARRWPTSTRFRSAVTVTSLVATPTVSRSRPPRGPTSSSTGST